MPQIYFNLLFSTSQSNRDLDVGGGPKQGPRGLWGRQRVLAALLPANLPKRQSVTSYGCQVRLPDPARSLAL